MARSTFKVLFYVNGSKEKNGIVPIMGLVTINGTVAQFSCKRTIHKELWDAKGNRAKGKSVEARDISGYEDAFKTLISGEKQYARHIGGNVYEVVNVPWMVFNMNHIPSASDTSHGYFRRMLYLIFDTVIPEDMQNKHLADDLKTEYPGILNWIVRGGKYLKQNKFNFPQSSNGERQKLIEMGKKNPVMSWAKARDVRPSPSTKCEPFEWIKVTDLYDDMARYVRINDFEENMPTNETVFGRFMTRAGFGKLNRKRSASGILYKVYGITAEELSKKRPPLIDDLYMSEESSEIMYDFMEPDDV